MNSGLFSSKNYDWETPAGLFEELNAEFGFNLDVCAITENAKCERYFTPRVNGLAQCWRGVCFMNPPYGREIGRWVAKAYEEAAAGATVVCLLPARTDTRWFHDYCVKGEVRFIKGRVKFRRNGKTGPAPFPSMVVVFRAPQGK